MEQSQLTPQTQGITKRQSVNYGPINISGQPDFFTSSGLNLTINASESDPLVYNIAGGAFGDYYGIITQNKTISLVSGETSYVYIDTSDSIGSTILQPDYGYEYPGSPVSGQCFFSIPRMRMEQFNGSTWIENKILFIGEATTNATTITEMIGYAYRGETVVKHIGVTLNQTHILHHYLGVSSEWYDADGVYNNVSQTGGGGGVVNGSGGWRIGDGIYTDNNNLYFISNIGKTSQNSITLTTGDNTLYYGAVPGSYCKTGDAVITVRRKF